MYQITISNAANIDPSHLAEIRANAMRPSLEAVGRFDEERVRKRFLDTYDPADTHIVRAGQDLVGFYVLRTRSDHLHLTHLYISLTHQGGGLGRRIVLAVQDQARDMALHVRLMALRGSPANDFYTSCGFVLERSDDLDNYYIWEPA
ncbi:N-acetyltransferase [Tateyamaria omphalii]|uniref:GNAT family N-acetyltransferase n=1 Tax=Tateyamaria omphalii TaxID=299262 RepID=UPI00198B6A3A|nr:GNAT family N-acetyltransferase [Tateyamaria omphalii]GGX41330.1 N-acetyltransferase [Tateyamaria omphalii]